MKAKEVCTKRGLRKAFGILPTICYTFVGRGMAKGTGLLEDSLSFMQRQHGEGGKFWDRSSSCAKLIVLLGKRKQQVS